MNINKLSERGPHTHLQRYIRQKVQRFVKANEKKRKKRNIFFFNWRYMYGRQTSKT